MRAGLHLQRFSPPPPPSMSGVEMYFGKLKRNTLNAGYIYSAASVRVEQNRNLAGDFCGRLVMTAEPLDAFGFVVSAPQQQRGPTQSAYQLANCLSHSYLPVMTQPFLRRGRRDGLVGWWVCFRGWAAQHGGNGSGGDFWTSRFFSHTLQRKESAESNSPVRCLRR